MQQANRMEKFLQCSTFSHIIFTQFHYFSDIDRLSCVKIYTGPESHKHIQIFFEFTHDLYICVHNAHEMCEDFAFMNFSL